MKKFLSIFIALLLIVSLFATTAVAFAEESSSEPTTGETTPTTPTEGDDEGEGDDEPAVERKVTIIPSKLNEYLAEGCAWFNTLYIEMGDRKFGEEMMKDSEKVKEAFQGIQYAVSGDPDYDDIKNNLDKIYVEYCRPSESPKGQETWQNSENINNNIRISSSGSYLFRFVVKDKDNKVISVDNPEAYLRFIARDTSRPVVSLSTTMTNKQESGLTAGTKYSIPTSGLTSGSTDEMSSTTVQFEVYKVVNGVDTLIYDSREKKITEGYKDFVDADGAITPSEDDISENIVYKVKYFVTDVYGYTGVESKANAQIYTVDEYNPVMALKVVAAPPIEKEPVNVLVIVLFSIAVLSAIGIVVLIFVKPKEAAPARVATAPAQEDETAITDETQE